MPQAQAESPIGGIAWTLGTLTVLIIVREAQLRLRGKDCSCGRKSGKQGAVQGMLWDENGGQRKTQDSEHHQCEQPVVNASPNKAQTAICTSQKVSATRKKARNRNNNKLHRIIKKALVRYVTVVVILITIHNVRIATNPHPVVKCVKKGQGGMQAAHTIHSWIYRKWGAAAWELRRKQWDSGLNDVEGGTKRRMEHGQGGGKQTETPTTSEDGPTSVTEPPPAPKPEEGPEPKSVPGSLELKAATTNAPVTAAGANPPVMQRTEPTMTRQTAGV